MFMMTTYHMNMAMKLIAIIITVIMTMRRHMHFMMIIMKIITLTHLTTFKCLNKLNKIQFMLIRIVTMQMWITEWLSTDTTML